MASALRSILVTGANQGLGYHTVHQLGKTKGVLVFMGSRRLAAAEESKSKFASEIDPSSEVVPVQLDVTDAASIKSVHDFIEKYLKEKNLTGLDVLINNAGIVGKTLFFASLHRESLPYCSRVGERLIPCSKIPVEGINAESFCNIPKNSQRADLLRHVVLILWDEVGMQDRFALEAVDRTLRDLRNDQRPFGGVTVVFGGDFQQILPVVVRGSREKIVGASIQPSHIWQNIEVLHLRQNMRLESGGQNQRDFASWLLDVGHGRNISPEGNISLRDGMCCNTAVHMVSFTYPNVDSNPPPPPDYFLNRMILAPRNADVNDVNSEILEKMAGESRIYFSADKVIEEAGADGDDNFDERQLPVEFLRSLNAASLPPGELNLKIGCPLILLRNLAPAKGFVTSLQRHSDGPSPHVRSCSRSSFSRW
ncbi:PIF1-like helicase-domain-containing protein [Favolaschia claudopus]|uniref:ATP-dependent DNA helicase n=1 Tax=Favolaschia claudopus TaxID=2862362 RepID=A0AAV9Z7W4_9AGAR